MTTYNNSGYQRDNQRQKVYDWEGKYVTSVVEPNMGAFETTYYQSGYSRKPLYPIMRLDECQALVDQVYDRFGYTSNHPVVKAGQRRTRAGYEPTLYGVPSIKLPLGARIKPVVLHEIAHGIVHRKNVEDVHTHGGSFMRIYIELLCEYMPEHFKLAPLKKSATESGLKVASSPKLKLPPARKLANVQKLKVAYEAAKAESDRLYKEYLAARREAGL